MLWGLSALTMQEPLLLGPPPGSSEWWKDKVGCSGTLRPEEHRVEYLHPSHSSQTPMEKLHSSFHAGFSGAQWEGDISTPPPRRSKLRALI